MLRGSICGALASIFIAAKRSPVNPVLLNSLQIFTGGFILFSLSLFVEGFNTTLFTEPQGEFFAALLYLASLPALGFSIWFYLLSDRAVPATELSLWKFIIPLGGAVFSWILIDGESPDILSLGGMGAIALAIILFFRGKKSPAAEK